MDRLIFKLIFFYQEKLLIMTSSPLWSSEYIKSNINIKYEVGIVYPISW